MRRLISLFITLALALSGLTSAHAASSISLYIKKTPSIGESKVSLYGQIKPARSNVQVRIESNLDSAPGVWNRTSLGAKSKLGGSWRIEVISTAWAASAKYRAVVTINGQTF